MNFIVDGIFAFLLVIIAVFVINIIFNISKITLIINIKIPFNFLCPYITLSNSNNKQRERMVKGDED